MISVKEALEILHQNVPQPRIESIPLDQAYEFFLSRDIFAPEGSPRYTNSAMDGYAVRWEDCMNAAASKPVRLTVIGESQAGIPFIGHLGKGTSIRISTGAMLPSGADSVVRIEDTNGNDNLVEIYSLRARGQDVRYAGEEFRKDTLLFPKGTYLKARELAMLATVGISEVDVYRRPRVSLLITGSELARYDDKTIKPHQIRDSNGLMLSSAVLDSGAALMSIDQVVDSLESTIRSVKEAVDSGVEIILCSGGVSVGQHDHVKDAALATGFEELFWKIRQKPGKPLYVCKKENTLLFGLPGNPVSAFMCFNNYVRPVLAELQGTSIIEQTITAKAVERIKNSGKRTNFVRVTVENNPQEIATIKEVAQQGSHMLSSIVHADGYIIITPDTTVEPDELIEVTLF